MVKMEDCEKCKKKGEDQEYKDEKQKIIDSKAANAEEQINFLNRTYHTKHEHVEVPKPPPEKHEKEKKAKRETTEDPRWTKESKKEEKEVEPPASAG